MRELWRPVREKIPLIGFAALSYAITLLAQSRGEAVESMEHLPSAVRIANAFVSYATCLGKMIWPSPLAVY